MPTALEFVWALEDLELAMRRLRAQHERLSESQKEEVRNTVPSAVLWGLDRSAVALLSAVRGDRR